MFVLISEAMLRPYIPQHTNLEKKKTSWKKKCFHQSDRERMFPRIAVRTLKKNKENPTSTILTTGIYKKTGMGER
jgi:hypothetical protein